jgi:hypothetical protein
MRQVKIGDVQISRLVIGGNPFSGFSHQGPERDREMKDYYTVDNIKAALRKAEAAGVNTVFARSDRHVRRLFNEYWNEGGSIQWVAQTASEYGDQLRAVSAAVNDGATGAYIHGGIVDYWFANGEYDKLYEAADFIRDMGVITGMASHLVEAHEWMRDNLELDFEMCCYYNPSARTKSPHHVSTHDEKWDVEHRGRMLQYIQSAPWSVVHYKVFAGGNRSIDEGWRTLAANMRENDLVCIGHYLKENPNMIAENVATLERMVEGVPA